MSPLPTMRISEDLAERLRAALAEDVRGGDVTSEAIIPSDARGAARMVAKQPGVISGIEVAREIFRRADPAIQLIVKAPDGTVVETGDVILELVGPLRSILTGERVALNFLQRMSGTATLTRHYAEPLKGTPTRVYDTRKTNPLWRDLDRFAVLCGGGANHRYCLDDMILIKDNHIDVAGSVGEAVRRARAWREADAAHRGAIAIMAETRNQAEVTEALAAGADYIMLDNMSDDAVAAAVAWVAGRVPLEVSGSVSPERMARLAQLGIDRVSVGALTHSAPGLDISLLYGK